MDDQDLQMVEYLRRFDPQKAVNGCDGAYEPENRQPHGAMRPGKTHEDRLSVASRPRVIAAEKRAARMAQGI